MRVLRFDSGELWDNPNAYFGDPSFVLEPGDLGYIVPPPPPDSFQPKPNKKTMSSNATPKNQKILIALAHRIHMGQAANGVAVGLFHHTAATMDLALKKLEGDPAAAPGTSANKGSQLVYRDCVDATGDAETAMKALSDGAVKEFLTGYRLVLTGVHGTAPDAGWEAAGFPPGSTAVPRTHDQRLTLLGAARAYLAAHPTYEAVQPRPSGPPLAVSAATALALQGQMNTARMLIQTREAEQTACRNARDVDFDGLFGEVSGLIAELRDLLTPADPRWELFGLNIPANPTVPEAITSLTVTALGTGQELAEWSYAVRMESTRLFLKQVGIDTEFINVADPKDLDHVLKGLTPGTTISVFVRAHNAAGDGPASPTLTKVVGA